MPVVPLVNKHGGCLAETHGPLDRCAIRTIDFDRLVREDSPIPVLEIGNAIGERRQRNGIAPYEHLTIAMPYGQRRTIARGNHQVILTLEENGERKSALEPGQHGLHSLAGQLAMFQFA